MFYCKWQCRSLLSGWYWLRFLLYHFLVMEIGIILVDLLPYECMVTSKLNTEKSQVLLFQTKSSASEYSSQCLVAHANVYHETWLTCHKHVCNIKNTRQLAAGRVLKMDHLVTFGRCEHLRGKVTWMTLCLIFCKDLPITPTRCQMFLLSSAKMEKWTISRVRMNGAVGWIYLNSIFRSPGHTLSAGNRHSN